MREERITSTENKGELIYRLEMVLPVNQEEVWKRIANVQEIRSWDSMISEISGEIREGGKVRLRSKISPNQEFRLRISDVTPQNKMKWSSGVAPFFKGVRSYHLSRENGQTRLVVEEVFSGWLLPLMKSKLPSCDVLFGSYARDLRKALTQRKNNRI